MSPHLGLAALDEVVGNKLGVCMNNNTTHNRKYKTCIYYTPHAVTEVVSHLLTHCILTMAQTGRK